MEENIKKILDSLKLDLEYYSESIEEIANDILENEVSEFPIFIAHQHEFEIGEVILDRKDFGKNWTINVSILEELVEKGILQGTEKFKKIYKSPKKYMCVLLVTEKGSNFLFLPYKLK